MVVTSQLPLSNLWGKQHMTTPTLCWGGGGFLQWAISSITKTTIATSLYNNLVCWGGGCDPQTPLHPDLPLSFVLLECYCHSVRTCSLHIMQSHPGVKQEPSVSMLVLEALRPAKPKGRTPQKTTKACSDH